MIRYASLDDAENRWSQDLCEHCKAQPECVTVGYSSGPPTLRSRNAGESGVVYQQDSLGTLHEVIIHSSLKK